MLTADLSGMGGGYEEMCQKMLWRGVAFLAERKPPLSIWNKTHAYSSVYGVMHTEGAGIKELEKAIIHEGDDVTGAMHQCVMGHLAFIHKNGTGKWIEHLRLHRKPAEIYEWSGDLT